MKKDTKQIIVVRKDLNMSIGKTSAQVSHASINSFLNCINENNDNYNDNFNCDLHIPNNSPVKEWLNNSFTKVVVYVKSEKQLLNIYEKAKNKSLPCSLIKDEGRTELNEPTYTCIGIGPCYTEDFNGVTDKLRLLS